MSPAVLRAIFGSCLTLGLVDLAWLDTNAARLYGDDSWERLRAPLPVVSTEPVKPIAPAAPSLPPTPSIGDRAPAAAADDARKPDQVLSWSIQFDRSLSIIRSDQAPNLAAIAEAARDDARAIVQIGGHADRLAWKGNRSNNLNISEDRALAVARALAKLGIPSDRIQRAAFGDTRPLDERATEEAYRRNRRVEVRIELKGGH
jgi:outer membrane protein OmpA-like peptidoglycan-associated protein